MGEFCASTFLTKVGPESIVTENSLPYQLSNKSFILINNNNNNYKEVYFNNVTLGFFVTGIHNL